MEFTDDFPARFSIATTRSARATVVAPAGELELAGVPQLACILAAVEGPTVVLDLRAISFVGPGAAEVVIGAIDGARRGDRGERGDDGEATLELADVLDLLPFASA